FLDERGRAHGRELYGSYCQDHKPVAEQDEPVGHAVRAGYLYCGMADVAALTGRTDYIKALDRIWLNVVSKKLYITGGIGATGKGEAFGEDYELPNTTAYCETCAAIANALWNHRMFLLKGDAKYIDVLERVIYNGFLSGVSLSGEMFFYRNPLASDGKKQRSPWFGCACCPTNVVRFIPSVPGYVYATKGETLYVNLFISGSGTVNLPNNKTVLKQQTRYPWEGDIRITVEPEKPKEFAICVRVPDWARNQPVPSDLYRFMNESNQKVTLRVNGEQVVLDIDKGFASIKRTWKQGDTIELNLPMPIRRVLCNEKVKENNGRAALQRGPIVYCAEAVDNGGQVAHIVLNNDAELHTEYRQGLLGGASIITGKVLGVINGGKSRITDMVDFTAIPYYAWAHRGGGEMAVWLPAVQSRR
ncbi:MAG: glycoside hydrolase family 127 protein, partial [Planctomycetota bacterium]